MPIARQKITPCLWFDSQAEEAARFYVSVVDDPRIGRISRYSREGHEIHGRDAGSVMTVEFEFEGQRFVALNGGPHFSFSEAISFQVHCDSQEEIDYFLVTPERRRRGGACGWLKDRFGLSWQVVPTVLPEMLMDADSKKSQRVSKAFLQMKKFDLAELERPYAGQS